MSVAPSITWPLVAIRPSLRMKKPVPMPRTGVSLGPLPPWPYMRSRNSRKGSLAPPRAVVATIPTTAGIDDFTSAAMEIGGGVGRSFAAGASVQSGLMASSSARASVMRARVGTPLRRCNVDVYCRTIAATSFSAALLAARGGRFPSSRTRNS